MKQEPIKPGYIYHLYNRGNNKENIFKMDKNYFYFLFLLQKHFLAVSEIYAYCLLNNHFHLVIKIKDTDDLPDKYRATPYRPISNMFNAYTKSINNSIKRKGSLFQEHLHRHHVKDHNYLINLILYIHLNPIKHGFSEDFQSYRFTSYNAYISDKKTNISKNFILELMGGKENFIYLHEQKEIIYNELLEEINKLDKQT